MSPGGQSEGGAVFSASEALGAGAGSQGHRGETAELQPHQRQHGALHHQPT